MAAMPYTFSTPSMPRARTPDAAVSASACRTMGTSWLSAPTQLAAFGQRAMTWPRASMMVTTEPGGSLAFSRAVL